MVNDLRSLLHESSENAPYEAFETAVVLRAGRSRTRRHRVAAAGAVVGAVGLSAAVVVGATTLVRPDPDKATPTTTSTAPVGPVLHLSDARPAELDPIFTHVNEDLEQSNGQYVDGITTDGLAVFRDGPHGRNNRSRMALIDLDTGEKSWLPDLPFQTQWLLEATDDRLVYFGGNDGPARGVGAVVFDRRSSTWHDMYWPSLPRDSWNNLEVGPDGRLYVALTTARADTAGAEEIPVDDAGAIGETGELWSVSLTDPDDVRDEGLSVGTFAFDESHLVWTDRGNGVASRVFVRDLTNGDETSFDPRSGSNCNQLGLSVDEAKIIMSQYCGTDDGVRDDRVQVVTLSGEPVVTIQDEGIDGGADEGGQVLVHSYLPGQAGAYAYDLSSAAFLQLGTTDSMYGMGGPVADTYVMWTEGYRGRHGSTQKIARMP